VGPEGGAAGVFVGGVEEVGAGELGVAFVGQGAKDEVALLVGEEGRRGEGDEDAGFAVDAVAMGAEPLGVFVGEADLGAMMFFEASTPLICKPIVAHLRARGVPDDALGHFVNHATVDVEHSALFRQGIADLAAGASDVAVAIEYGMDCFAAVYPDPVFSAAHERARTVEGDCALPPPPVGG
jgi:hypothetical protein